MNDPVIRKALLANQMVKALTPGGRVVHELGLQKGRCRADVAVITPMGFLAGFEIKGSADTLTRLPVQVELYSAVFDTCTLVAHTKHIGKSYPLLPVWWGIVEAHEVSGKVVLRQVRGHQANPGGDPMTVARLIWKEEVEAVLRAHGVYKGMTGANREVLYYRLLRVLGPRQARIEVARVLIARTGWRGAYKTA